MDVLGIPYHHESFPETEAVSVTRVEELLQAQTYNLVSVVHCETSSGMINPVESIGTLVHKYAPGRNSACCKDHFQITN